MRLLAARGAVRVTNSESGYAEINNARLYYETAGTGKPIVMIHAGIADSRMWENEFMAFGETHRVIRFDLRGYGKSLPVKGEFNLQDDLAAALTTLDVETPLILMGCSIVAGLAMDFAWTHPEKIQSLILVGGAPDDLELETQGPDELFAQSEQAFQKGDIDQVAEIDMKIWFDGFGRPTADLDPEIRKEAYNMARLVARHEIKQLGTHIRKSFDKSGIERLRELMMPVLVVIGENNLPYLCVAADYMVEHLHNGMKVEIPNAAHLPNMEHPRLFQTVVSQFLAETG